MKIFLLILAAVFLFAAVGALPANARTSSNVNDQSSYSVAADSKTVLRATPTRKAPPTPRPSPTRKPTIVPPTRLPTATKIVPPTRMPTATRIVPPTKVVVPSPTAGAGSFTMAQTLSDGAQLTTLAFDGLAFLTGNPGSDSFFPPGKVADFWGFQYLRDNDPSGMGHNTDFLTRASLNMFSILDASQNAQLITLAKGQVTAINDYGYKRFVLMSAFRRQLSGSLPSGTTGLSQSAVKSFSADLYQLDGEISYQRALVMGSILSNLNTAQKTYLAGMVGKGMTSWPVVAEPDELRGLSHDEKVAVMTYAGDLFSWYAGSLEADVYFCPERQGTYFGSFYMKDAPAVGNPGYSIGTNITADYGNAFIKTLSASQAPTITNLVTTQKASLLGIVDVRTAISTELRKAMSGVTPDQATVLALMRTYGELDGEIIYQYATAFSTVNSSLTSAQSASLTAMRQTLLGSLSLPSSAYLYATPITYPTVQDTAFLFK
jgi:hypothetical protein